MVDEPEVRREANRLVRNLEALTDQRVPRTQLAEVLDISYLAEGFVYVRLNDSVVRVNCSSTTVAVGDRIYVRRMGPNSTSPYIAEGAAGTGATGPTGPPGPAGSVDIETAITMGYGGFIPNGADLTEFCPVLPFPMYISRLKATLSGVASQTITIQLRASTDGGNNYSNFLGTVDIVNGNHLGEADYTEELLDEGDMLNFSVSGSDETGANLILCVIGRQAV